MDRDVLKKTSLRSKKETIILVVLIATNDLFASLHQRKTFKISHRPGDFFLEARLVRAIRPTSVF